MTMPKWAPDGSKIYAVAQDGMVHSIPVQIEPFFAVTGAPHVELNWPVAGTGLFDIFPDGERFFMPLQTVGNDAPQDSTAISQIHDLHLIINLPGMLEKGR